MSQCFHLLVHHVLDSLFDLGEGDCLAAVVQHSDHGVHAPEHLCQHLVLVRQGEAWRNCLSEGVVPLVRWQLSAEGQTHILASDFEVSRSSRLSIKVHLTQCRQFLCIYVRAHLPWACVSRCLLSSFSSFLVWALAASSLARATVNLRAVTSQVGGVSVLGSAGVELLGAGAAGETEGEGAEAEAEEAALVISSACFLIL